jgi:MarR family transcriptional regulator for hemolysin
MKEYTFEGNFLYYVRLVKRLYEQTLTETAEGLGLTLPEADVLCFLRENPEFDTARDVALYRDVSRAYVSKAVELLVGKGYLEIRQDKDDRRYQHLKIAPKAQETAETLHRAQFEFYRTVTENLSDTEMDTLMALIGKCAASVERADKK